MYEHPVFAEEYPEHTWCLHCERAFRTESWVSNDWECPNLECDGSALDAWTWDKIREANPDYPGVPEHGALYGLYG